MTIAIGDVLKIVATLMWTDGEIMQNVFNAIITGTGGPYDDDDIIEDALDWVEVMYANMTTQMSDMVDGSQVQVYIRDTGDDDWDEVGIIGWTFDPTNEANAYARGVAGLCHMRTTDPDVFGKKYIGGSTEAGVDDAVFSAGALVNFLGLAEDWATAFVGATSGADWTPGIWSVVNNAIFQTIDSFGATTIPAYQRRRKQGVGA